MNSNVKILLAGLLSGAISGLLIDLLGDWLLIWAPGLVFGIVFGFLFALEKRGELSEGFFLRIAGFALLSVAAYRIAVFVAQKIVARDIVPLATGVAEERFWIAGIVAGLVGATILAGVTWMLRLRAVNLGRMVTAVAFGAAAGVLLHYWPLRNGELHIGPYLLYIPWQCGVGFLLFRREPAKS